MEILVGILIPAGFAIWVYNDAKKHDMNSPSTWAIFVFLILIIGLPVYLAKRPNDHEVILQCPNCEKYYEGKSTFCPNCGVKVIK